MGEPSRELLPFTPCYLNRGTWIHLEMQISAQAIGHLRPKLKIAWDYGLKGTEMRKTLQCQLLQQCTVHLLCGFQNIG